MTPDDLKKLQSNVSKAKTGVDLYIGIDPGVNTGYASWSTRDRRFLSVTSMGIIEAMELVLSAHRLVVSAGRVLHVVVEDTRKLRLPKHLQSKGRERGAGSVGRDMAVWSEFLTHHSIPHTMAGLSPKEFRNGDDAWFRSKTGWDKRTSEHGRCAAGMVWGK